MAYAAAKLHDGSSELERQRVGELSTYQDTYEVVYSGAGGFALADALAATGAALPVPKVTRGATLYGVSFVCLGLTLKPNPDHPRDYIAVATYGQRMYDDFVYAKITRTAGVRLVDQYRRFTSLPTDGAASFPPASGDAITGTAIDICGNPAHRYRVPVQVITLETLEDAAVLKATLGNAIRDYDADAATYAFKRNNAAFLGWGKGKVLFEGYDESPVDDIWRLRTWRFVADAWYHLEQRPALDINGQPWLTTTATWADGTVVKQLGKAYWYQPYETLANFSALVPSNVIDAINNPSPAL